jgi:hypothetical protein
MKRPVGDLLTLAVFCLISGAWVGAGAEDVILTGEVLFSELDGSPLDQDGEVNGVFTVIDGSLTVEGVVRAGDCGRRRWKACPMVFVVSGDITVAPGGAILAEGLHPAPRGGRIALTAGGDLVLRGGTGTWAGAVVSAGHAGSQWSRRRSLGPSQPEGEADLLFAVAGRIVVEDGAVVAATNPHGPAGRVDIRARGPIDIYGLVASGPSRLLSPGKNAVLKGGSAHQAGGDVTVRSDASLEPALRLGGTGIVLSQGNKGGAGRVLLEGCGLEVEGLVASLAREGAVPAVVLRSGRGIRVDGRDLGRAQGPDAGQRGEARAALDRSREQRGRPRGPKVVLIAQDGIEVLGPVTGNKERFAISASPGKRAGRRDGARVLALSLGGSLWAAGRAFAVGPTEEIGGTVSLQAADDVRLDDATIEARGDEQRPEEGRGGTIAVRAFQGALSWTFGLGDVRPGHPGRKPKASGLRNGTILLTYCTSLDTTGTSFPTWGDPPPPFPEEIQDCTEPAPTLPPGEGGPPVCNQPPVAADDDLVTNEDVSLSGNVLADNGNGPDVDPDGDPLTVTTTPLSGPTRGLLTLRSDGSFDYVPEVDYWGTDVFEYEVSDDDGETDVGEARITILSVNDPPSFTGGPDVTVDEDAGPQEVAGWATAISPGPANESGQVVGFEVTANTDPTLFAAGPAVSAAGALTFTPAPDANGSAAVTLVARDDGGTDNGGEDTSTPHSFVVSVTPVNDRPVIVDQSFAVDENSADGTVVGTVTIDDPDVGQAYSFVITEGNSAGAFAIATETGLITVANSTALDFEVTPLFTLTVEVSDDGVPPLGDRATVTVNLNDVNEPPVALPDGFATAGNTVLHVYPSGEVGPPPAGRAAVQDATLGGVLLNDTDPDAGSTLHAVPASGVTAKGGTYDLRVDGSFRYVPPLGVQTLPGDPDAFAYEITDGVNVVGATVQVRIQERIWYADNSFGTGGDGSSGRPFDTLSAASAAAVPGDIIFVHTGDGTTTNQDEGIVLAEGQRLQGQGVALAVDLGGGPVVLLPGSSPPLLTNTATADPTQRGVSLADDNTVVGLTIDGAGGAGIFGQDVKGHLVLRSVTVTGCGGPGLAIDNANGGGGPLSLTVEATGSAFELNHGGEIRIVDNVGDLAMTGLTLEGSSGIGLLLVRTTGNVTLSGSLTRTGGQALALSDTSGNFDLAGLTVMADDSVSALNGIPLTGLTGTYAFGPILQRAVAGGAGFTGPGLSLTDSPGAVVDLTGNTLVEGVAGDGVRLVGNAGATVIPRALAIVTTSGTGLLASDSGIVDGELGIVRATGGAALDIDSTSFDLTTFELTSTGAPLGIRIENSNGRLIATSTTITSPVGDAILLRNNPGATIDLGSLADIATTAGAGIVADNTGAVFLEDSPDIAATGGPAVDLRNTVLSGFSLGNVSSTSSLAQGVNLEGVTGAFSASGGSISGAVGTAFRVSGGASPVTFAGSIANSSGRAVEVSARAGDTVSLSGTVDDTGGEGILLDGVAAGVTFGGAVTVSSSTTTAVTITNNGAGTTTFADLTVDNSASHQTALRASANPGHRLDVTTGRLDAGNGRAVHIDNTDLGVTLVSVSSDGGSAPGIELSSTTGGFAVTGDGGTAVGGNGSGGFIGNKTGADGTGNGIGVLLTNAAGVSLANMRLAQFDNYAIRGIDVSGFDLASCTVEGINGTSSAMDEGSLSFTNLLGAANVTNSTITGAREDNLRVENGSGTLDRLTLSGGAITGNDTVAGGDGVFIQAAGSAVVNVTVTGVSFSAHRGDHFQLNRIGSGASNLVFSNNSLTGGHTAPLGQGVAVTGGGSASLTYDISGNNIVSAVATAINVNLGLNTGASWAGTISGNVIGVSGIPGSGSQTGNGIAVVLNSQGSHTAAITNNTVVQYAANGIDVLARDGLPIGPPPHLSATVTGNTVAEPYGLFAFVGLRVQAGAVSSDTHTVCADIRANSLEGSAGSVPPTWDFRLRQRFATTMNLPGYTGAPDDTAAVVAFLQGQNTGTPTGSATRDPGGGGYTGTGTACPLP